MTEATESDKFADSWFIQLNRLFYDEPIVTERALGTIARIHEDCQGRLGTVDKIE
jgi:hypothetical protein